MTTLPDLGLDALVVTIGSDVLSGAQVGPVTLRHGRPGVDRPPTASTCTLTVPAAALTALPAIGTTVDVQLGPDALAYFGLTGPAATAASVRFSGRVTDPSAELPGGTKPGTVSLTAVSRRARLGNTFVGDAPWPAELDGARAARILALIDPALATTAAGDPGTVTVLARDVDRQPALALLEQLGADSGGLLAEDRAGVLSWQDADHRRNATQLLTLGPDDVLAPARWAQELAGLVNDATVTYGTASPQDSVQVVDAISADPVAGVGPYVERISTQLATVDDATSLATLLVGRRSRPTWQLDALQVDLLRSLSQAQAALLLQAEFGALIGLEGFPAAGPLTAGRLWLEGWQETITRTSWRTTLLVSAYGISGAAPRWVDVPTSTTWADVPADVSWLTATSWELPSISAGRWADVPADQSWATTDPALTYTTA